MKKLLFFIMILFGILSTHLIANFDPRTNSYDYGCGPGVPPSVCGANGNNGGYRNSSPLYYGAIAVDPFTRKVHYAWKYTDRKEAQNDVLKSCGSNCVSNWGSSSYITIAISEDDKHWGHGTGETYEVAENEAISRCQNAGKPCYVVAIAHPDKKGKKMYWGGLAYNPNTGIFGKISNEVRKYEAEISVLKKASCDKNSNCYFHAFQTNYGSFAIGESGEIYYGLSDKSQRDAEKEAEKQCKKNGGEKKCKILVSSESNNKK